MRQSGLEGVALACAGRLLAAAVATWAGRGVVLAKFGRLPLAGLAEAIARVVGLAPLASDPLLAAVAAVVPLFGVTATEGRALTALPVIGAALALARVVLFAEGLALAVWLARG